MYFDEYKVLNELGSGVTGQVYLILDPNDKKFYALKTLDPNQPNFENMAI
jgi:serine/threonine protein kinase